MSKSVGEWVSVAERLPDRLDNRGYVKRYLFWEVSGDVAGYPCYGYLLETGWWVDESTTDRDGEPDHVSPGDVTHWAEIKAP